MSLSLSPPPESCTTLTESLSMFAPCSSSARPIALSTSKHATQLRVHKVPRPATPSSRLSRQLYRLSTSVHECHLRRWVDCRGAPWYGSVHFIAAVSSYARRLSLDDPHPHPDIPAWACGGSTRHVRGRVRSRHPRCAWLGPGAARRCAVWRSVASSSRPRPSPRPHQCRCAYRAVKSPLRTGRRREEVALRHLKRTTL